MKYLLGLKGNMGVYPAHPQIKLAHAICTGIQKGDTGEALGDRIR